MLLLRKGSYFLVDILAQAQYLERSKITLLAALNDTLQCEWRLEREKIADLQYVAPEVREALD